VADRTVRAIFEARVAGAQKGMRDFAKDVDGAGKKVDGLTKDLKTLGAAKVKPTIDVKIDDAKKRLSELTRDLADLKAQPSSLAVDFKIEQAKAAIKEVRGEIKDLNGERAEVRVEASIKDAQKRISDLTVELGALRTMDVSPVVTADIKESQKKLREARAELRELNGAKAEMKVTADTSPAKKEIAGLADDVGDAGAEGGEEAGGNIVTGILDALRTIPIAGAVVGVGVAIGAGLFLGIKQGLAVEAERDLFSAQTGLDEDTSARFGRAAGEAYANAWGDSVAANLDTARLALQAGIIDSAATDAEIESVIAKLTGLNDLFQYDIAESVRGVGNLMKTGLVRDADQAFDFIVKASQQVQSDDLLDTLNEYSNQFVQMGITGAQAFGLLAQGAKAGARDTDNVADTIKEMNLRIGEGSKAVNESLGLLGLRGDIMGKAFNRGGAEAAKAVDTIFDRLRILEAKGGNTQQVIANLFGGPGEDLGASIFALNLDTAADSLNGVDGAAGAADRALTTMADNTAAKMESAQRNVELAMDGIKGALAEAFGDDMAGAADWVTKNRAPLMIFFLDAVNGVLDIAKAFALMGATGLDAIADIAVGFADMIDSLPNWLVGGEDLSKGLREMGAGAREAADEIRDTVPAALEEVRQKANGWAAPEIMKARIHDATIAMTEDLEVFAEKIADTGGVIRINGDRLSAEAALKELIENINGEDGTVTINGDKVPAEDALEEVLRSIENGEGNITVGANTEPAEQDVAVARRQISMAEASMTVTADLTPAERELREFKAKLKTLGIRVSGVTSVGGQHDGGFVAKGLHSGGRVPGSDPGYDNVLWPLNSGGRTLSQPLAGGEYVVNSKDAAYWAPMLEWMNGGGRPTQHTEDNSMSMNVGTIITPDVDSFQRKAERDRAAAYAANRNAS
jgi:hypothetical protein